MPINYQALSKNSGRPTIDPRKLFLESTERAWPNLRPEQDQVLAEWFEQRHNKDNLIIQNTGRGKTLTGLLIAYSGLKEGVGPAVYAAPNTYLRDQVVRQAHAAGIPVTENFHDVDFHSSKAIFVCTIDKVINGRSVFGLRGNSHCPEVGTIIVDDAHLAASRVRSQFGFTVNSSDSIFKAVTSIFNSELNRQSSSFSLDSKVAHQYGTIPIPFWEWRKHYDKISRVIDNQVGECSDHPAYFPWPILARNIKTVQLSVTSDRAQFQTMIPLLDEFPSYMDAKRRIFMTATVPDSLSMIFNLGIGIEAIERAITPTMSADIGDRVILAPHRIDPSVSKPALQQLVLDISRKAGENEGTIDTPPKRNVVVLCPSNRAAESWRDKSDVILPAHEIPNTLKKLEAGETVGIMVLANKYDGIDLPDDACRLLVVDELSAPLDLMQQRETAALRGTALARIQTVQRLEQGMGRGIRSVDDFCAVLLLDPTSRTAVTGPENLSLFSDATRRQIELSQQLTEQIEGEGIESLTMVLDDFLAQDRNWKNVSRQSIAQATYTAPKIDPKMKTFLTQRASAWQSFIAGDYEGASAELSTAIGGLSKKDKGKKEEVKKVEVKKIEGWFMEELAYFTSFYNMNQATHILKQARKLNREVTLPLHFTPEAPKGPVAKQSSKICEHLSQFQTRYDIQSHTSSILDSITFSPDRELVDAAEDSFCQLGSLLGFSSSRPDKDFRNGPDVLWRFSDDHVAVIEMKTGTTREDKSNIKAEAGQLSVSVNWATEEYPDSRITPILVARSSETKEDAVFPSKTLILTEDIWKGLKKLLDDMFLAIAHSEAWGRKEVVESILRSHSFSGAGILQFLSKPSSPSSK
ncbi:helicase C-terminal domain-containing protein [Corynebacterium hesseae]